MLAEFAMAGLLRVTQQIVSGRDRGLGCPAFVLSGEGIVVRPASDEELANQLER
jgi:hypothetical protein